MDIVSLSICSLLDGFEQLNPQYCHAASSGAGRQQTLALTRSTSATSDLQS